MIREAAALFVAAFTLCGLVAGAASGCAGGDCNCPPIPEHPEAQPPLGNLGVMAFDEIGNEAAVPVSPENGTLEVTGDRVVIAYDQDGVEHRVVYDVVAPR